MILTSAASWQTHLVGPKDSDTPDGLLLGETLVVTLEQDKDVLHRDVLDVDLVLVVEVCDEMTRTRDKSLGQRGCSVIGV